MACYYLVISSTHLSNGHFRSIKGVFRGPLHKTGTALPGYAEKGKSIANALEDLKANFYCELCDKQYHKHQEFDNHINSYDHAHKQRLKELKQREFARNVASKSWKDEKKQEKALKRLHQLAELRKQPDCVAEEVPLFKAPRLKGPAEDLVTGNEEKIANLGCAVTCGPESVTSGSTEEKKPDILYDGEVVKDSSCCFVGNQNQIQVPLSNSGSANNRAGVSFCFSKKALLKLDSSASVFNESLDEVNEYNQFLHQKAKQMSVSFRHYAHLNESAAESSMLSEPDETDMSLSDNTPANAEKSKDDKGSLENSKEHCEIAQSNITAKMHSPDASLTDQQSQKEVNVPAETEPTSETTTETHCQMQSSVQETCSSKHTVADAILIEHFSYLLSQKRAEAEPSFESKEGNSEASNDLHENPGECPAPGHSLGESVNTNTPAKALSFLSVVSKDGNTILQWPTELVLFTKTQPSISYACNPLYFDFKCSPKDKMKKSNDRENGRYKDTNQPTRSYKDKASCINVERVADSEIDSPSIEPKSGVNLDDLSHKDKESSENYQTPMGFTHRAKNVHDNDNEPQIHNYYSHSSYHSRKRKRSSHGQSDHCMVKENIHCKEKCKRRSLYQDSLRTDKSYSSRRSSENRQQDSFSWENSDGWKDSDSDTSSDISHKSSTSQLSYSSSSMSSGSSCRYKDLLSRMSAHEAFSNGDNWRTSKHKSNMSSESGSINNDKKLNCKCKHHKHNTFRESNEYLEQWLCSKHGRNKHRSWKKRTDRETESAGEKINLVHEGNIETVESTIYNSRASPEDIVDLPSPLTSPIDLEQSDGSPTKDFLQCHPHDVTPVLVNCQNNTSKKIVEPKKDNDQEHLDSDLYLDSKLVSVQTTGDSNRTKEFDMDFNKPLENISPQCNIVGHDKLEVPLHDKADSSSNNVHSKDHIIDNVSSSLHAGSEGCKVTVVTHCDNNSLDNVIHIDSENRTEIEQQKGHLIREEEQPIMQSPDPVHLNFSYPLPYLRHPGGIDSPETKEDPLRLGLPDVNISPSLVDVNLKCFYDSTMQDFRKMDNRWHHKPTGPPLAQQPVTFSPDEVDKYKVLQMQAQQHMQKQLLTKHFKALPTNGSTVFSATQTIQPVSIQHHPSITTIHHALMQQYAVTASMHSHVNHFPLPHLNHFPQSQFPPISLSPSLTPTLFPTPPPIIGHALAHPLHLVSAAAIHPPHLTIQAIPHATLIPTIFAPHPNTGMHPTLQLHPLIHPLFQGQEFHHHSGSGHLH